ncbi:MAG: HDOD domain-containing protein [Candidatus Thiodiazotropha endolucinida]
MPTLWEKVTREAKLISLPEAYLRLKSVVERPDYAITEIADAVSTDPALTTRVLKLVNSPYFGLAGRIETVIRAVSMLGAQQIHDLALTTCVANAFSGIDPTHLDMRSFWRSSAFSGLAAQQLAKRRGVLDSERLFVAGLLSDIGHLILYQSVPQEIIRADNLAREQQLPLVEVERELLGLDYARVGAVLMRQWQLPDSLIETTEFHPEPLRSRKFSLETSIVHIAVLLSRSWNENQPFDQGTLQPHPSALDSANVSSEICLEILETVESEVDKLLETLAPLSKAS